MITWKETRQLLTEDRQKLREYIAAEGNVGGHWLWLNPSYQSVFLFRLSHYFFANEHRLLARFFWHLNVIITGADVSPISQIKGGLVIVEPLCTILLGKIGKNFLVQGNGGTGGGMTREDIGAGLGLPILGDDVKLRLGAFVLGAVRVGDRVDVGPRCLVQRDVPDDAIIRLDEPRKRKIRPPVEPEDSK